LNDFFFFSLGIELKAANRNGIRSGAIRARVAL